MKRYSVSLICLFVLLWGCASTTDVNAQYNAELGNASIKWNGYLCDGEDFNPGGKSYYVKAFFHPESVSLKNWKNRKFEASVQVTLIPYIQEIHSDKQYILSPKAKDSYSLVMVHPLFSENNAIKGILDSYPRILLTPKSEKSALTQKELQNKLQEFLQKVPEGYDFIHTIESGQTKKGDIFFPEDGSVPINNEDNKPVEKLKDFLDIIFSKKSAAFFDGREYWEYGRIGVWLAHYDKNGQPDYGESFFFEYTPRKSHSNGTVIQILLPKEFKNISPELSQELSEKIKMGDCTITPTANPCEYQAICPEGVSGNLKLQIPGFQAISVSPEKIKDHKLEITPDEMIALLKIKILEDYWYGNTLIAKDSPLEVPLNKLSRDRELRFTFLPNVKDGTCDIQKAFDLATVLREIAVSRESPCKKNIITIPKPLSPPVKFEGCIDTPQQNNNSYVCRRSKREDLTLCWDEDNLYTIPADKLNGVYEYRLSLKELQQAEQKLEGQISQPFASQRGTPDSTTIQYTIRIPQFQEVSGDTQRQLAQKMELRNCRSIQPADEPGVYIATCPKDTLPDALSFSGIFEDVPLEQVPGEESAFQIKQGETLKAVVPVVLPWDAGIHYTYNGQVIIPGQEASLTVPEKQFFSGSVEFAPSETTLKQCRFSQVFMLEEVVTGGVVPLETKCQQSAITWEETLAAPAIKDCIRTQRDPNGGTSLSCLHLKTQDLTLVWDGYEPLPILLNTDGTYHIKRGELRKKLPSKKTMTLVLPEIFNQSSLDLSQKMQLQGCIFKRQLSPREYEATCLVEQIGNSLIIPGLRTVLVQQKDASTLEVSNPKEVMAEVKVKLDEVTGIEYTYKEQKIQPKGETEIQVPLAQLSQNIALDSQYPDCPISTSFSLDKVLQNKPFKVSSPCQVHQIRWPETWEAPNTTCVKTIPLKSDVLECVHLDGQPITLDWGKGWEPVKISSFPKNGYAVQLSELRVKSPLQANDPWLKPQEAFTSMNPCESGPGYKLSRYLLFYCQDKNCKQYEYREAVLQGIEVGNLPDLERIGWNTGLPFPNWAILELQKTSPNPTHKDSLRLQWNLPDGLQTSLEDYFSREDGFKMTMPVQIHSNEVPFDPRANMLFFPNHEACENQTGAMVSYPYAGNAEDIRADACTWAMVELYGKRISKCIQGQIAEDAQHIEFLMQSNKLPGSRLVVMVANSQELSQNGRGIPVRDALADWLRRLQQTPIALNLFVVKDNNFVEEILRGEDLKEVQDPGYMLQTQLPFNAAGFLPLRNIDAVARMLSGEAVRKVLFFTDSRALDAIDAIPDKQLGTLFGWKQDNTQVTILTDSESHCQKWTARGLVECIPLGTSPQRTLIDTILQQFLSQ